MADVLTTPKSGVELEERGLGEDEDINLGLAIALPVCLIVGVLLALLFFACVKYRYLFWKTDRPTKGPLPSEKSHFWIENALPAKDPGNDALSSVNASILSTSLISEGPGEWYRAIHHYEADEEGRLSLEIGQLVEVKEKLDTGWWLGFSNTDVGWFPATYVEPLSGHYNPGLQEKTPKDAALNKSSNCNGQRTPDAQKTYKAVCIYKPNGSDELAVQPGDTLVHVNRDPNGWVKVKNKANDLVGWVPMATLEEATAGEPNTPITSTPVFKDGSDNHITGIECVSVYKYEARDEGDLNFEAGESIVAFQILDNGWWRGYHNLQEGWFPGSYVQIVPQSPATIDSGYTSPRTPNSKVRINLESSFAAAAASDDGHLGNSRDKVNGNRNPFFLRFNSWKDQMSTSKMFHPRVVRVRASQLKKRIGSQFKRINVPPPPAPPKNSSPTVVMVEPPPLPHEMPSCSHDSSRKDTTLTLEGFETGETLDTGEAGDSTDGEFDDVPMDDSDVNMSPSPSSPTGLTTFDKIVIEKRSDPEEERKKKESLERAQKLLAQLQKAAPRKYSGEPKESVTNQYLKNKERKLSQESKDSASNFIKKISLDDDDAVFSLSLEETSVDIDSDTKSEGSDNVIRSDSALVSKSDSESSKSTDDVTKGLIVPSSESRNSSWGSKKDVPVVAVRPVGHERISTEIDIPDVSDFKLDIGGFMNGESNTDSDDIIKESEADIKRDSHSILPNDKDSVLLTKQTDKTDVDFGDKWDYRKLFAGLDDFNPSFELETNIDDVIEDVAEDMNNSDGSKGRNSKDLRLLIPPPAEFVDFKDEAKSQAVKTPELSVDVTPSENGSYNGINGVNYDRSVSVESEHSPTTPSGLPVAPSRKRRKGQRPPAPPPPPPPSAEISSVTNSSPVLMSPPISSSTPTRAITHTKPRTPVSPNKPMRPSAPVTPTSPIRPMAPPPPPTVSVPVVPSRVRSPTKAKTSDKPVEMRKNGSDKSKNTSDKPASDSKPIEMRNSNAKVSSSPVRKSVDSAVLRQGLNGKKADSASSQNVRKSADASVFRQNVDTMTISNFNGVHDDAPTTTRPLISAPIPTPELEEKPQVTRAIPLNGQSSKNQTLPASTRNPAGLPNHLRLNERSKTLPHASTSLPPSPSKSSQDKSSPKRRAPLPPTSAPVSPAKPPSPSKNLKVTFSEDLLVHKNKRDSKTDLSNSKTDLNKIEVNGSPIRRPPRPPPPKQPSPTPPATPTSPTSSEKPKSILVRSRTDSDVGSSADESFSGDTKNVRRVWKSHSSMMEGELSLPQDSLLRELEAAPGKPGFVLGMTPDGRIGTFPRSYLRSLEEPAPDPLLDLKIMEDTSPNSLSNMVF